MNKMISTDRSIRRLAPMPIWIAVFALLISGCAVQRPAANNAHYPSPEAALRAVATSAPPADQTFTATARIEINRSGERYPLKIAIMMKRPASLRVESIPLMGPPDFFLSVEEKELRVYLPGKNAFYSGRADPENISRFFPISMPADELLSLLMGIAPDNRQKFKTLRGEQEEQYFRVDEYTADHLMRSLWIDPSGNRLVRLRMFAKGETVDYEAVFAEHTLVGERLMPQRLAITCNGMAALTIRYTDLHPVDADPESFKLIPPDGITLINLDP